MKNEYVDRKIKYSKSRKYSRFNPAYLFAMQQREKNIISILKKKGLASLADQSVLEVGCGSGGVLLEFLVNEAQPKKLFGFDILFDRLGNAHHRLPNSIILNADGQKIPFISRNFDLVVQYTAFSSILDFKIKQNIALEMIRVLKPGGLILWYDFWFNPINKQTKGILPKEIKYLFPACNYKFKKITLAPPIAEKVVPFSWGIAYFLEKIKIFNTHYIAIIEPK